MTPGRGTFWCAGLVAAMIVYGATVLPGVSWGDSGEAQLHTMTSGWLVADQICRSHVTYFAVCRAIDRLLPIGPALAANIVAVIFGAITIANGAYLIATFCRTQAAIVAGTLLLLLSHTLWQMSTAAEVVTLSTALITAELIFCVRFVETRRPALLAVAFLCNGLGISTHNMAMLMWPAYGLVFVAYWKDWRRLEVRTLPLALVGLIVGLTPVLALCADHWLTHGSIGATLKSALIGNYRSQVFNVTGLAELGLKSAGYVVMNFPTPVLVLVVSGFLVWYRRTTKPLRLLITTAAVIFVLFAVRYNVPDQFTFFVHTHVFVAIFCAVGVDRLLAERGRTAAIAAIALSAVSPLVYLTAPTLLRNYAPELVPFPPRALPYRDPHDWFLKPWRTGYDGARRYARETLDSLPEGALLSADSTAYPPIVYLQTVESLRRDVRLDGRTDWQTWREPPAEVDAARQRHLATGTLFTSSDLPQYLPRWLRNSGLRFEPAGHVFRVIHDP